MTEEYKEGLRLFKSIEARLAELIGKVHNHQDTEATHYAAAVGFMADLQDEYNRLTKDEPF